MPIILVPAENVEQLWPIAAPMLERAISYTNGATSLDRVLREVVGRRKQLWFIIEKQGDQPEAAGVTSLQLNDDGTSTANIELLGGEQMKKWFGLMPEFEAWARVEGCSDIRFAGRKEWARLLPDYKVTHYVMRKVIE